MSPVRGDGGSIGPQHTPGPWHVEPWHYASRGTVPTVQNNTDAVAQVLDLWCMDDRAAERDANARLIAAAPELLAALLYIVNDTPEPGADAELTVKGYNLACAALAKAEGRDV